MKQIPNLLTLLNLVFGVLAIVYTLQNGLVLTPTDSGSELIVMPEKIFLASLFIALAGFVDFIDGFVARLLKADSEMGKQLDSLADVVSFGVAPALIVYQFLRLSIAQEEDGLNASIAWLLPAFLLPCAAAWRLARFNLDTEQSHSFKGVPAPAAGLFFAAFPLIFWNYGSEWVLDLLLNKWFWYALVIIVSALMISRLPLMAFKFNDFTLQRNWPRFLLMAIAAVAIIALQWMAVPVIFIAYIILSLALKKPA